MKQLILFSRILLPVIGMIFWFSGIALAAGNLQDIIDLPAEVHDKLKQKLEDSREYTEDQMASITRCLDKGNVRDIVNCLSDDGLDEAVEIGYIIRDEMSNLRDKVCGGTFSDRDRCEKLQDDVKNLGVKMKTWGSQLQEKWSKTVAGGRAYLEKRYELTRLKRKICDRINQEGCWNWLNERLDLHCKPSDLGNDPEKLKQCRLRVAREVWSRLEARQ